VIAAEDMLRKVLGMVEPVFRWVEKSYCADDFLDMDDKIIDSIDSIDISNLDADSRRRIQEGRRLLGLFRCGFGVRQVYYSVMVPLPVSQANGFEGAKEIQERVR
jgi:hypothetical protein